jgi:hypothetical protein
MITCHSKQVKVISHLISMVYADIQPGGGSSYFHSSRGPARPLFLTGFRVRGISNSARYSRFPARFPQVFDNPSVVSDGLGGVSKTIRSDIIQDPLDQVGIMGSVPLLFLPS